MNEPTGRRRQEFAKRHLGRGLSALLGGDEAEAPAGTPAAAPVTPTRTAPIEFLHPSAMQPRTAFDEEKLEQLAQSIREKGVLQPILVREHRTKQGEWEIVAGERRWRAAQKAQLHDVPIVVRDLSDRDTLEIALIENVQRQDLNPIEEARAYRRLMQEFAYTQETLSEHIGKSRPHISNLLRLLELPEVVREMLADGRLTVGHARPIINLPNVIELAQTIVAKGLSVRDAERLAQKKKTKYGRIAKPAREKDADTKALERDLTAKLGLKAEIQFDGKGGALVIHYQTLEQLDEVIAKLNS
ncbi:ParB/RepB/Spo0J family partition protein [Dongia deserti]|uniref:ParB/RepB/Spo0J family partition protein n=1 Tax=Dongia deserti TaxID=2268030 RepID=UPI000E64EEEB|nr:ParB/RepB/Spo0J family partition protein [Dongia deserti]